MSMRIPFLSVLILLCARHAVVTRAKGIGSQQQFGVTPCSASDDPCESSDKSSERTMANPSARKDPAFKPQSNVRARDKFDDISNDRRESVPLRVKSAGVRAAWIASSALTLVGVWSGFDA
eukprot:gnl/MRDRNA2_/MRDRNA2_117196_c0_seq1.p2 gnl/MRDRNA2_/MRDRNA2_117196_c0~~gnl/MRDRNA2_/MRDRNA2_117196_c0_seq1.p2  ORF type:complete len:121 (+),score=12.63 gnl/MRDRNA2_/MRDRNA2_117196_c0_seq1:96-458(+)